MVNPSYLSSSPSTAACQVIAPHHLLRLPRLSCFCYSCCCSGFGRRSWGCLGSLGWAGAGLAVLAVFRGLGSRIGFGLEVGYGWAAVAGDSGSIGSAGLADSSAWMCRPAHAAPSTKAETSAYKADTQSPDADTPADAYPVPSKSARTHRKDKGSSRPRPLHPRSFHFSYS